MDCYHIYYSDNDLPLLYHGLPHPDKLILSMEDYLKWYDIHAITPGDTVLNIAYSEYENAQLYVSHLWSDHCVYPPACVHIAKTLNAVWCERSLEVIYGRYQLEIVNA